MRQPFGSQSMVAPLKRVIVKRPEEAFQSHDLIETQWRSLHYTRPPDPKSASREHQLFVELLKAGGAEVLCLPADEHTGLDSIYSHDPVLITDEGAIIFQTGKEARRGEGPAFAKVFQLWNIPILGAIEGDGTAEAGDMVWLDHDTLLVSRSFRTNADGLHQLAKLLRPLSVQVISVELPYWNGPEEVLHLMSLVSLLDRDLAVVYRRLMPVPLYEIFTERGVHLIDVADEEYGTLGCNVLAVSPRDLVMVAGNPITRSRLRDADCKISEFEGSEICFPGAGGPTCLTRPLLRDYTG